MTSTADTPRVADAATPNGPATSEVELRHLDYEGHRTLVPTPRQLASGVEVGDRIHLDGEAAPLAEPAPAPRLRERIAGSLAGVNPFGLDGPKLPLIVLGLSAALGGWSSAALGVAAPEIQATFGTSVTQLTLVSTVTGTFLLIIGIPMGYLVDRFSRVGLIRISALLAPVGDIIQATTASFGVFTAGNVLGEIARTPASGADMPLLSDYFRAGERARAIGFLTIAGTIGGIISAPVVGYLVEVHGWRTTTLILCAMSVVVALLTFLLREPRRGDADRLDMGVTVLPEHEAPPPTMGEALRGAWAIRTLRLQAIAGFVSGLSAPLTILLSLVLASKFALGPMERSWLSTGTALLMLPTTLIGVSVADRLIQRKPSTLVALQAGVTMLSSVTLIAQAFAPNLAVFFICSLIPAALGTLIAPLSFTVMSLVVPARYRGVGMQVFTPFTLVSTLLAPAMVQFATQISLEQSFLFFAPVMLLSGLIYLASASTVSEDIKRARASALGEEASLRRIDTDTDTDTVTDSDTDTNTDTNTNTNTNTNTDTAHVLVCRGVEACVGEATILRGVDLDIRRGEILGIVGTNGAGKSTLLTALCGLNPATNGAVFLDGRETTYLTPHELADRGVAYLPGGHATFGDLTVLDNLRIADPEGTRIDTVFQRFEQLVPRTHTPACHLSGGEQQMLALGMTFLRRPTLLLIDELSLGLAPSVVARLLDLLRELRDEGTTVVIVEQSLNIATEVCDRLVYMDGGAVTFTGTPREFLAHPELVRSLFMGGGLPPAPRRARTRQRDADQPRAELLTCTGIGLAHGDVTVLHDVTLDIAPGELVGVIGPNGAGKTSLFDVISGYETPTTGAVHFVGQDITDRTPDARARLGLSRAFQDARLFGPLTVRETIAVALEHDADRSLIGAALRLPTHRHSERRIAATVDDIIATFGLGRYADVFIDYLSTGTRRAVEVACHTAASPHLLLLDEPSSGLAQSEVEGLGPMMRRIVHDLGCAVVVIEHDLPLLTSVADRLIALDAGAVLATGTPHDVLTDDTVRRSYLHASDTALTRSGSSTLDLPEGDRS